MISKGFGDHGAFTIVLFGATHLQLFMPAFTALFGGKAIEAKYVCMCAVVFRDLSFVYQMRF